MGRDALDLQPRLEDGLEYRKCLVRQGSKASHAGVDLEVDWGFLGSRAGKKTCLLDGGKSGDEALPCDFTVFRWEGGAEEQDRNPLQ